MNVLYRVEFSPRRYAPVLLVQSMTEPTWSRLPNSYVLGGTNENGAAIKVKMIDEFLDSIETGQVLRFRLLADPTRKIKTTTRAQVDAGTPKSNGCRVPLRDDETRLEWLSRKGKDHGFNLLSVRISKEVPDVIVRSHGISEGKKILQAVLTKKGKKDDGATTSLTFEGVLFDGYLRVTDKALLVNAIRSGIGPGKAYGFGLLSVAPCQHPDA